MRRFLGLLVYVLALPSGSQVAAAGFFLQGASLTWYHPKVASNSATSYSREEQQNVYKALQSTTVTNPSTGKSCPALEKEIFGDISYPFPRLAPRSKALVVVMPHLGDNDSMEYAEQLVAVLPDLRQANIELRVIGIGNCKAAQMFSLFTGLPLECIRVDPTASLHQKLQLSRGPNWEIPGWVPDEFLDWFAKDICGAPKTSNQCSKQVAESWINYVAQWVGSPRTLQELARGFMGDKNAPERLYQDEKIRAGSLTIHGTSAVSFGKFTIKSFWHDCVGQLRPGELASCRLRNAMEVATKFDHYVTDQRFLDWRGATFLLDANASFGKILYDYKNEGVLSYSETMDRPLSFLSNYIGLHRARNPCALGDPDYSFD